MQIVRKIAIEILQRLQWDRELTLRADFRDFSDDDSLFGRLQRIRRYEFLKISAVEIERLSDQAVLDLRLASSGELGIVTNFLGLASVIDNDSLGPVST